MFMGVITNSVQHKNAGINSFSKNFSVKLKNILKLVEKIVWKCGGCQKKWGRV
jgi:hypothetical protein